MNIFNETIIRLKKGDNASISPFASFLNDKKSDFLRVYHSNSTILENVIIDFTQDDLAHVDGIQIIPQDKSISLRYQYIGGEIDKIGIHDNKIYTPYNNVQGIFSSDGLLRNTVITNNFLFTKSFHKISLNGLMSGYISNNCDLFTGKQAEVLLNPLRIGGGLLEYRIWIMSFSDSEKYFYSPLNEIFGDVDTSHVTDNRFTEFNDTDIFLYNFDLDGYQKAASEVKDRDIRKFIEKVTDLAFGFADDTFSE